MGRDLKKHLLPGERIVLGAPVSGRAVIVFLAGPVASLSGATWIIRHREDIYYAGLARFGWIHANVTDLISSMLGISHEISSVAAYAISGAILLGIAGILGRLAIAHAIAGIIGVVTYPIAAISCYFGTTRAITNQRLIINEGLLKSSLRMEVLERIQSSAVDQGYLGTWLNYGDVRVVDALGKVLILPLVSRPNEVSNALNSVCGVASFTAQPIPEAMIIEGSAKRVKERTPVPAPIGTPSGSAHELEQKAAILVKMLIADPDNPEAWAMLSKAYTAVSSHGQAVKARRVSEALKALS